MKVNKNINNLHVFYLLLFLFLIIIVGILYSNYYYGKEFKLCKTCSPNEIFYVDIEPLSEDLIETLETEIRDNGTQLDPKLNFNNTQGKKLNFHQLPKVIQRAYENRLFKDRVSSVVGETVEYADVDEKYRIFARLYENENDFIDWHYDNNFTVGNRYTLVIPVVVDNGNTSEFMIKDIKTGGERVVPIPIGKGVVYNGSITYHKISKQTKGNRRLVVIIPFYSNYKKTPFGHVREFLRNVVFNQLTL